MPHQTPEETIAQNIENPRKGQNNMGLFEQQSLPDQIAAAKFLADQKAGASKNLGLLFRVFNTQGTI